MAKRLADTELNQDNYDYDFEKVERGQFQKADSDLLKNRVILTAKRTSMTNSNDVNTHGILKNFTGLTGNIPAKTTNGLFQFGQNRSHSTATKSSISDETQDKINDEFFARLSNLNESFLQWVQKHLIEDPICILSPIFKDYDKHLKELEIKYKVKESSTLYNHNMNSSSESIVQSQTEMSKFKFGFSADPKISTPDSGKKLFDFSRAPNSDSSSIVDKPDSTFANASKPPSFLFGASVNGNSTKPATFSFGGSAPSFLAPQNLSSKASDEPDNEEEDYVPPEPEKSEQKEEGASYEIRCKMFWRIADNWKERGIGNAFIKPITGDHTRFQLVIRADNKLSNILLNILVNESIMVNQQKNTVSIFCVPNPPLEMNKSETPPEPNKPYMLMLKVKTEEKAKEFLDIINSHRGK